MSSSAKIADNAIDTVEWDKFLHILRIARDELDRVIETHPSHGPGMVIQDVRAVSYWLRNWVGEQSYLEAKSRGAFANDWYQIRKSPCRWRWFVVDGDGQAVRHADGRRCEFREEWEAQDEATRLNQKRDLKSA